MKNLFKKSMEELSEELNKTSKEAFIKELRTKLLGSSVNLKGRSIC